MVLKTKFHVGMTNSQGWRVGKKMQQVITSDQCNEVYETGMTNNDSRMLCEIGSKNMGSYL